MTEFVKPNKANRDVIPDGSFARITFLVRRIGRKICIGNEAILSNLVYESGDSFIDRAEKIEVIEELIKVGDKLTNGTYPGQITEYTLEAILSDGSWAVTWINATAASASIIYPSTQSHFTKVK